MSLSLSPKGQTRRLQRRALSHLRSLGSRPVVRSLIYEEYRYPFREPLHFIVISAIFPYTYGVFYVTVNG
jgi:hypothetical protein